MFRFVSALLMGVLLPGVAYAQAVCPELTWGQKAVGFVTLTRTVFILGAMVAISCFCYLFWKSILRLRELFAAIPVQVYESFGYILGVGLIAFGTQVSGSNQTYSVLIGCLVTGGMIYLSSVVHEWKGQSWRFFGTLFVLWSIVALLYQNSAVGFIAIVALIAALSTAPFSMPGIHYEIGKEEDDSVEQTTGMSLIVLWSFIFIHAFNLSLPAVRVFESGAFWVGSIAGFGGLLIVSNRWYRDSRYSFALTQIQAVGVLGAALYLGATTKLAPVAGLSVVFLLGYALLKPFDFTKAKESRVGFAIAGLISGSTAVAVGWWAHNNMDIVRPYVLF